LIDRHQAVLILDFGSQYTQLIARRLRENGVFCEIHPPSISAAEIESRKPIGLIYSGGPQSVYDQDPVKFDREVLKLGIPTLGICYGMQLIAQELGGRVESSARREYGRAEIQVSDESALFQGLSESQIVWMSHGDSVQELPTGFSVCAGTENSPTVAIENRERGIFGIQFHPEVSHTESGSAILENFLFKICRATGDWSMASYLEEAVETLEQRIADHQVLCALSGGVDSSVVAALLSRAVGTRSKAVFVDNGLLRKGEAEEVLSNLHRGLGIDVIAVDARQRFLSALKGVEDPEEKRRTIGRVFIDVFKDEAAKLKSVDLLAQGTLYPDVIESTAVSGPSAVIKTHHNVGGLPEELGFELVEPLRWLFKDEVRRLGIELGLDQDLIGRHPFPGPGLAVRLLGQITPERLEILREADHIFIEELRASGLYDRVGQAFAVLLPISTVGVMGDFRTYENVVALRAVETQDFMTADWSQLPAEFLGRVANRIVNEVRGINRVVYDITSKPPATIEWE
jgi:GMP synthase (glutamine-hydrolysing)